MNTASERRPAGAASEAGGPREILPPIALQVPDLDPDTDTLSAALAYAAAGWYVVPIRLAGDNKHAGSLLGKGWPAKSSRDPQVLVSWFAGTSHGLALHCGRSGALSFDVDHPEAVPDVLAQHLGSVPFQSSRADQPGRGHYVFAQPPGVMLGNGRGKLRGAWGEVRGRNGIIVAAPTPHGAGGLYQWQRSGPVPALPAGLLDLLPTASADAESTATDTEVAAFIARHTRSDRPNLLSAVTGKLRRLIDAGGSRHESTADLTPWAMREAAAGLYPAAQAVDELGGILTEALVAGGRDGAPITPREAAAEWAGILSWAVGQAMGADPAEVRAAVDQRAPDVMGAKVAEYLDSLPDAAPAPVATPTPEPVPEGQQDAPDSPQGPPERPAVLAYLIDWQEAYSGQERSVDWLVVGIIERGRLVAVYSAPKAGKSLLLLAIAAALASGRSVLGQPPTGELVPVLYCDYENTPGDVVDRLRDLGYRDPDDLTELHYLSLPALPPLDTPDGGRALLAAAQAVGAELVVIDTASRTIHGAENDADTWNAWYLHTGLRLKRAGIALVRLDHSGKDATKGQRGSNAKAGDVDLVLRLVADHDRLDLITEAKRQPYYPDRTLLRRREVDGVLVHELTTATEAADAATTALMDFLDAEGIPVEAGRPTVKAHLDQRGYRATHRALEAAIRLRKLRPPSIAQTARAAREGGVQPLSGATAHDETRSGVQPHVQPPCSPVQPIPGTPTPDCTAAPLYKSGQRAGGHPGSDGERQPPTQAEALDLLTDHLGATPEGDTAA
ncbi:MAG: AAA family ATPase [Candidatus Nanopelagicales bacterium]